MSTEPAPRRMKLTGLHHVTAICRDLAATTAFYSELLGLRLVEQGVNDDDPGTRHFWFGDATGRPGTLVSFLEYPDRPEGRAGPGAPHHFAFSVESGEEQRAWVDYLRGRGVACTEVFERGVFSSIYFRDPDDHIVEIATRAPGFSN